MFHSTPTSAPMLMWGNTPPTQRSLPNRSPPTGSHPTDNPPQSARKNGAGGARRRGGRRRGRPPSADRHRPRGTRSRPAPAQDTPQQQDAVHRAHFHERPTLPRCMAYVWSLIDKERQVMSHVTSSHVTCHIITCHIITCHFITCHIITWHKSMPVRLCISCSFWCCARRAEVRHTVYLFTGRQDIRLVLQNLSVCIYIS